MPDFIPPSPSLRAGCGARPRHDARAAVEDIVSSLSGTSLRTWTRSWASRDTGVDRLLPLVADLRRPAECDRVFAESRARFGGDPSILVNNAGLTFTFIDPTRFRRETPQRFWEVGDDIIQAVMDTNYVAADQMARRAVPLMLKAGWGRVINVTTKLDTMNRAGSSPYGPSKAALEMATEIWAKELAGTGVTINIVNPGAGANTPGMAAEMRARSAASGDTVVGWNRTIWWPLCCSWFRVPPIT